ncbi:MAG: LamG-like jellyroll fold domain-containing protein [Candidatus Paceibacterota bacterium]
MFIKLEKGFTLIEILASVAIIALLAGITMINFIEPQQSANLAKLKSSWAITEGKYIGNLVGKWTFDEGTGSVANDSTDSKNNGVISGATWVTTDKNCISGKCLSFDGVNDHIDIPNSTVFDLQTLSISAWVYSTNYDQNGFIFEKGPVNTQYSFFFQTGSLIFRSYNTTPTIDDLSLTLSTAGITNSNWYYVVATYNGANKIIYVNGVEKGRKAYAQTLKTGQSGETIGIYGLYDGYPFVGTIDEVSIYSGAITISQIRSDYLAGLDKLLAKNLITQTDYNQRIAEIEKNNVAEK